jgi:hypothetical protein
MLKGSSLCLYSSNLGTFCLKIEQFWPFEEISIFSNSSHLEWRAGLSDTILKGTHPATIPARIGLIWLSGFRGDDLNPNLNCVSIMMTFLAYITGFFMNFALLPILTDCANLESGGMIFFLNLLLGNY